MKKVERSLVDFAPGGSFEGYFCYGVALTDLNGYKSALQQFEKDPSMSPK